MRKFTRFSLSFSTGFKDHVQKLCTVEGEQEPGDKASDKASRVLCGTGVTKCIYQSVGRRSM